MPAPRFSESFAEALKQSARQRGFLAFVPWWLLLCLITPGVAYAVWAPSNIPEARVFMGLFSAFAVVGGFLGSVSISSMSQIQRTVSTYPFSDYLKELSVFESFLMYPQLVLAIQLFFIFSNAALVFLALVADLGSLVWLLFYLELGLLVYTCTKTWAMVDLIRKLMWHFEEYTNLLAKAQQGTASSSQTTKQ